MSKSLTKLNLALVEGKDTAASKKNQNKIDRKQKKIAKANPYSKNVKKSKSSLNKNHQTGNDVDENIRKLLLLSSTDVKEEEAARLVKRAKSGHYVLPEAKPEDNSSVFTEEDFAKFEKEFFCS